MAALLEWLLAGAAASIADYGLGMGFGLAASLFLAALLGYDPRSVAAAAAAAQTLTIAPALASHRRAGIITAGDVRDAARLIAVIAAVSTVSAAATAALASRLTSRETKTLYLAGLLLLAVATLLQLYAPRRRVRRPLLAAAAFAAAAGAEKAVTGGGYTALLAAAATLAGVEPKKALAMAPAAKLPPYLAVLAFYTAAGYLNPVHAAALTAGALAATPLASTLLARIPERHAAKTTALAAAAAAALSAARLA